MGPRTPSGTSEDEEGEVEKLKKLMQGSQEDEEEEEEEEEPDSDSGLFNEIFGSSSSSDFEADIASLRKPKKPSKPPAPKKKKPTNLIATPNLLATPPAVPEEEEEEVVERIVEYKKRERSEEETILNSFLEEGGFDKEDMAMMRLAYVKLKENESELITNVSWAHYPHTGNHTTCVIKSACTVQCVFLSIAFIDDLS